MKNTQAASAMAAFFYWSSETLAKKRMYSHQNPGMTQTTNIKGNVIIKGLVDSGKEVETHSLPDNGLLHYCGVHVNLAAGLEDSIVSTLKPAWNKMGI